MRRLRLLPEPIGVAVTKADQIEDAIEAECRDRLLGRLLHHRLGTKRDAEAGKVRASAGRWRHRRPRSPAPALIPLLRGDLHAAVRPCARRRPPAADDAPGDTAIGDLELIGMDTWSMPSRCCRPAAEVAEAARDDRGTCKPSATQRVETSRSAPSLSAQLRSRLRPAPTSVQPGLSSATRRREALAEVELAAHRPLGDRSHLGTDTRPAWPARRSPLPRSASNPCRRPPAAGCGGTRCPPGTRCRRRARWPWLEECPAHRRRLGRPLRRAPRIRRRHCALPPTTSGDRVRCPRAG
jgi:hypothetical protein